MTFEREMDMFFSRNCYFEKERKLVLASPAYQQAEQAEDTTQAQEIAARIIEAKITRS